jgi:anaerobic ribonucleoside-triphosphate reductase activating protein
MDAASRSSKEISEGHAMLVHAIMPASRVNGPGLRCVVFVQGCNLGCSECWNSYTHDFHGTEFAAVEAVQAELVSCYRQYSLEGVTFSGGEPMQQAEDLAKLVQCLRSALPTLSFGMFTGYSEKELETGQYFTRRGVDQDRRRTLWRSIRDQLDFAVMGRYNRLQPSHAPMRTSANQVLRLFSSRYSESEFGEQMVEITIAADGLTRTTGFPTLGNPG